MVDSDEPSDSSAEIQALKERVRELESMVDYLTERNLFLSETLTKVAQARLAARPPSLSEQPSPAEGIAKVTSRLIGKSEPREP